MLLNLTLTDMRLESFHVYRVSLHVYGLSFGPLCNICFNKRNYNQVVPRYSCLFHVYNIHCCFILQPYCSVPANKSTVEHDFYKLTTIKLLHSNHCHSQARRHAATANKCWVEQKEEFALQRVALLWTERRLEWSYSESNIIVQVPSEYRPGFVAWVKALTSLLWLNIRSQTRSKSDVAMSRQYFPIQRHDDPSFYYGQCLGYGRVRVFVDLTHVHNISDMVESGYYLYRCADWSLYLGGEDRWVSLY